MNTDKVTSLDAALAIVLKMDDVVHAFIWQPTAADIADAKAEGVEAKQQLEVGVWRSCHNPSDVMREIEAIGLTCVDEGSGSTGTCYSFQLGS